MGACPERIISFKNYSVDMIASMIKAIEVPDETEDKPRVLIFACENDAYPALDMVGLSRASYDASVRIIPLRWLWIDEDRLGLPTPSPVALMASCSWDASSATTTSAISSAAVNWPTAAW